MAYQKGQAFLNTRTYNKEKLTRYIQLQFYATAVNDGRSLLSLRCFLLFLSKPVRFQHGIRSQVEREPFTHSWNSTTRAVRDDQVLFGLIRQRGNERTVREALFLGTGRPNGTITCTTRGDLRPHAFSDETDHSTRSTWQKRFCAYGSFMTCSSTLHGQFCQTLWRATIRLDVSFQDGRKNWNHHCRWKVWSRAVRLLINSACGWENDLLPSAKDSFGHSAESLIRVIGRSRLTAETYPVNFERPDLQSERAIGKQPETWPLDPWHGTNPAYLPPPRSHFESG